jgi:peptide/nickel transport system permease protein
LSIDIVEPVLPETAVPVPQIDLLPVSRRRSWRQLSPTTLVACALVAILVLVAIAAPLIAPFAPNAGTVSQRLLGIGAHGHLLGTDGEGRDIFSRLIYGARLSLFTGFVPVGIAALVGGSLGMIAGLGSERVHSLVMRTLDVFYAFPAVLLAITVAASLGSGVSSVIIALTVILIPPVARIAETETETIRNADFLDSARASGARWPSIAAGHVLPNIAPAILVYCTALIGLSIVYAAGLGFLGLGVSPPTAEWGLMISDGQQYLLTSPLLALLPAIVILITSILFNVVGDGLRQLLDVRSEGII